MLIKHLLLTPIVLFCAFSINAQITADSSFTDSIGLCWKGKVQSGKMDGEWTARDCRTKRLLIITNFSSGKKQGEERHCNTKGKKTAIYQYSENKLNGTTVYFYGNTGDTLGCVNYSNGVIHGQWRICDTNGRTMRFVEWEMGKIKSAFPEVDKFTRHEPPRNYRDYAALTARIMEAETEIVSQSLKENNNAQAPPDSVYNIAEVMPEFPGGMNELMNYLRTNIIYPAKAKTDGKQGTVYVEFLITKTGKVTNVQIVKGVEGAPELAEEAVRVVEQMPDWKPALEKGKPVAAKMTLPVRFKLQGPSPAGK
ncbi:MAG: TonB family protein [Bacteroidetes bacterium]|nr:TonB family protein [Bacteroidota bacterium]